VQTRFDAVGLGNAIVDALVRIEDESVLGEFELTRGQMTQVDDVRWQEVLGKVQGAGVLMASGGSCANTVAGMGLMGAAVRYCGQIGEDELGALYADSMIDACGGHALQRTAAHPTGKCLSLISTSDAERTMLTDLGAAVHLPGLGTFDEDIREAGILHVTGYLMLGEPMASRCMEAVAIANQAEIVVSVDVADPFVVGICRDSLMHLVTEFADVVFLNAEEARAMCGGTPEEALMALSEDVAHVVVKLGSKGSLVRTGGETYRIGIHPTEALDSTGAGDAYAAGYLYGLSRGWDPARSGDLGARVASLTVGQVGAVCRDREALAAAVVAAERA
jgi:sugar/nucleoside kinase (ribokinase family)